MQIDRCVMSTNYNIASWTKSHLAKITYKDSYVLAKENNSNKTVVF